MKNNVNKPELEEKKPYNQTDHLHCWESKQPPCGQKIEHLVCCLCEKPNPKSQEDRECLITESRLCANIDCKKHWRNISPKSEAQGESWEEEFDKQFKEFSDERGWEGCDGTPRELKSFIAKKLEEARKAGVMEGYNLCVTNARITQPQEFRETFEAGRQAAYQEVREQINKYELGPAETLFSKGYNTALTHLDAWAVEKLAANDKTI